MRHLEARAVINLHAATHNASISGSANVETAANPTLIGCKLFNRQFVCTDSRQHVKDDAFESELLQIKRQRAEADVA